MTRAAPKPLWVLKLGGSLAEWPDLRAWVKLLASSWPVDVVVVPGGGPFADQVRAAQARWKFDDATAHRMAILAMEQYGRMLCGMTRQGLAPATSPAQIRRLLRAGITPVWAPAAMCFADARERRRIAETWDMTSDSLSAWLAALLRADRLVLVKSVRPASGATLSAMVRKGLIDRAFPRYAAGVAVSVVWREDRAAMRRALRRGGGTLPAIQAPR